MSSKELEEEVTRILQQVDPVAVEEEEAIEEAISPEEVNSDEMEHMLSVLAAARLMMEAEIMENAKDNVEITEEVLTKDVPVKEETVKEVKEETVKEVKEEAPVEEETVEEVKEEAVKEEQEEEKEEQVEKEPVDEEKREEEKPTQPQEPSPAERQAAENLARLMAELEGLQGQLRSVGAMEAEKVAAQLAVRKNQLKEDVKVVV